MMEEKRVKTQWSMNRKIKTLAVIGLCYVIGAGWLLSSIWMSGYHQVRFEYGNRLESLTFCSHIRQDIMEVHLLVSNAISSGTLDPNTERSIKILDERIRQSIVYSQGNALKEEEMKRLEILYGKYRDYQERWRETRTYLELGYALDVDSRLWFDADANALLVEMEHFIKELERTIDALDVESEQIVESGLKLFILMTFILCAILIHVAWRFIADTRSAVDAVESKLNTFLEKSGKEPVRLGHEAELYEIQEAIDGLIVAQERMIHKERLSALGEMAGGIAHNLKTPLMAIGVNTAIMKRLTARIELADMNEEDGLLVARMQETLEKIPPLVGYADRIVDTLLSQTKGSQSDSQGSFSCGQAIAQLKVLLEHESKKRGITLQFNCGDCRESCIPGSMDALVQVLCNLAVNAMHAYEGSPGTVVIDFCISGDQVKVSVADQGCGMAEEVKDKVMNRVITTKGSNGTGLGLYISNLIIKGAFDGTMSITSKVGEGTRVDVVLPRST